MLLLVSTAKAFVEELLSLYLLSLNKQDQQQDTLIRALLLLTNILWDTHNYQNDAQCSIVACSYIHKVPIHVLDYHYY